MLHSALGHLDVWEGHQDSFADWQSVTLYPDAENILQQNFKVHFSTWWKTFISSCAAFYVYQRRKKECQNPVAF